MVRVKPFVHSFFLSHTKPFKISLPYSFYAVSHTNFVPPYKILYHLVPPYTILLPHQKKFIIAIQNIPFGHDLCLYVLENSRKPVKFLFFPAVLSIKLPPTHWNTIRRFPLPPQFGLWAFLLHLFSPHSPRSKNQAEIPPKAGCGITKIGQNGGYKLRTEFHEIHGIGGYSRL